MTNNVTMQESIDCNRSWEEEKCHGEPGYKDAIHVLEASLDGLGPVPAEGNVDSIDAGTHSQYYLN